MEQVVLQARPPLKIVPQSMGLLLLLFGLSSGSMALPDIQVQGLMQDRAVLTVEGTMHILDVGETSPEGIKVVAADAGVVTIEFEGERHELGLSSRAGTGFSVAEKTRVSLARDSQGHYFTRGSINGYPINMLVDTGATDVVLNSAQARAIGLNFENGELGMVSTASGVSEVRRIMLDRVSIGGLTLYQVRAMVIEGEFPEVTLLGNAFLSRVDMRQEAGALILESKF